MGDGTLISDVSGPRHSTDLHRGGARCAQNESALVPKNPLNQLEAVQFEFFGTDLHRAVVERRAPKPQQLALPCK
jgi:hypothetical protein